VTPGSIEASAQASGPFGVAFGPRFFLLLTAGLMWLGPAFVEPRFAYAIAVWDGLVGFLWLFDLLRLPRPGCFTVRRTWTAPPALSVASQVSLTLLNESRAVVRAVLMDSVPHELRAEPPSMQVSVGAGGECEADYQILPGERGTAAVGDAYIRYRSIMGVAERWARAAIPQTIVVYPNLDQVRRESMRFVQGQQVDVERRVRHIHRRGRSFVSLRDFREGDEFRDICWTASARRGELVTREYETERSQSIWIVIDAGRLMRARIAQLTKLDHAVNAALTLSRVALATGDRVGLLTYGTRIGYRLPASRGSAHLRQIIDRLALVHAEESEADHVQAASRLLADQKRRSLVVWITDLPDTTMTPEVVEAASQVMSRHLVIFVVIGHPELYQVAERLPETAREMYETAAAQEVTGRRNLLLARLRAHGALVTETRSKLSLALANAYLDVKQRNRL
jgi:uncharacterized protein (DUF58 family)